MVDHQVIDEWIAKAEEDYLFTQNHIRDEETFFAPLCFHCQQSVEKYLKAFLIARGLPLRKTHMLNYLLRACIKLDAEFENIRSDIKELDPYYIDTRYPVSWPTGFTKDDAQAALDAAGRIREFTKTKLSR